MFLSIGGRICLFYSICWGILAIYLIGHLNPKIDKFLNKLKGKFKQKNIKIFLVIITTFLFIDFCITSFALKAFNIRMVVENDIDVNNKDKVIQIYHQIYDDEDRSKMIHKFFGDKKMIRTFPNLKIQNRSGEIIYFDSLLPDIQPYYFKLHLKFKG